MKKIFLSLLLLSSFCFAQDVDLLKQAEQGDADAQLELGLMYENGKGVEQDYTKAVKWYRLAAEHGVAEAKFNLGIAYYHGQGVSQDLKQAKKLFGQACDNGNQEGCDGYRELNEKGI